jgi:hypothetical protein
MPSTPNPLTLTPLIRPLRLHRSYLVVLILSSISYTQLHITYHPSTTRHSHHTRHILSSLMHPCSSPCLLPPIHARTRPSQRWRQSHPPVCTHSQTSTPSITRFNSPCFPRFCSRCRPSHARDESCFIQPVRHPDLPFFSLVGTSQPPTRDFEA